MSPSPHVAPLWGHTGVLTRGGEGLWKAGRCGWEPLGCSLPPLGTLRKCPPGMGFEGGACGSWLASPHAVEAVGPRPRTHGQVGAAPG